jgi:hypothetical protein
MEVEDRVEILNDSSEVTILLDANERNLRIRTQDGTRTLVWLEGGKSNIWLGGNEEDGDIVLFPSTATSISDPVQATIHLSADGGEIRLKSWDPEREISRDRMKIEGDKSNIWLGGNEEDGDIVLFPRTASAFDPVQATIHLSADRGEMRFKSWDHEERVSRDRIWIEGERANIWLGGNGEEGDILLFPQGASNIGDREQATIHLQGEQGDIILRNADCAEDFDVAAEMEIEPGTVMIIDSEGKLRPSFESYDKKVAGVVSGAEDSRPGIILGRKYTDNKRLPIALVGKVFCKVDAEPFPIEVGDLLTTSSTPGHAMKVFEPQQAFGAVIGKALRPWKEGKGMIPILIALQ